MSKLGREAERSELNNYAGNLFLDGDVTVDSQIIVAYVAYEIFQLFLVEFFWK